jgi:hypothetical protein
MQIAGQSQPWAKTTRDAIWNAGVTVEISQAVKPVCGLALLNK